MKSVFMFLIILNIFASGELIYWLCFFNTFVASQVLCYCYPYTLGELYDDTYEEKDFDYYKSEAPRRLRGEQCSNLNKRQCKILRLPCKWDKKTGMCIRLGQPQSNGCTGMHRQQCMRVRGCKWLGGQCNRVNYHEV